MPAQHTAHGVNRIARSQSAEYVLGIQHGKHFCQVFNSAISYANIIDYGLEMWARQERPEPGVNDPDSEYSQTCFLALEKMYDTNKGCRSNKKLKEELRDEITGQVFRGNFCAGLGKGHGQGKCDDLSELKQLPVQLKVTGSGYNGHTMEILMTSSLLANDSPELREQLRAGDLDASLSHPWIDPLDFIPLLSNLSGAYRNSPSAPLQGTSPRGSRQSHSELYAGLYIGNKFPTDPANPFEGFMRSDLFVAALQTIFTGPGSAIGAAGSGERSKASKNGMTSLTLASLAHVATLPDLPTPPNYKLVFDLLRVKFTHWVVVQKSTVQRAVQAEYPGTRGKAMQHVLGLVSTVAHMGKEVRGGVVNGCVDGVRLARQNVGHVVYSRDTIEGLVGCIVGNGCWRREVDGRVPAGGVGRVAGEIGCAVVNVEGGGMQS
ncbi:hypothetical protein BDV93DRAFT_515452 [Ceratobasidium sp. AG-I]|nr:hypothetical protein BDV93DRAFT_515452 [Ceratobasidium sp. AG-I]